jgi:hypothetical protein
MRFFVVDIHVTAERGDLGLQAGVTDRTGPVAERAVGPHQRLGDLDDVRGPVRAAHPSHPSAPQDRVRPSRTSSAGTTTIADSHQHSTDKSPRRS